MSLPEADCCYVAFKACGCAVAACVIVPQHRKDTARSVSEWIRDGLRIETRSVEWVRANLRRCQCAARRCAQEVLAL